MNFRITFRLLLAVLAAYAFCLPVDVFASSAKAEKFFNQGLKSYQNGKYEEALKSFKKASELNPDMKQAWFEQGNSLFALGQIDKALDNYYVALEIDPGYKKAYSRIGECYLKKGDFKMAAFKLQEAAKKFPKEADIFFLMGKAYEGAGEKEQAVKAYKGAISLNNDKYEHLGENIRKLESNETAGTNVGSPIPDELPDASPSASASSPEPEETANGKVTAQVSPVASPSAGTTSWIPTDDDEALPAKAPGSDSIRLALTTIVIVAVLIGAIVAVLKHAENKKRSAAKVKAVKHPDSGFLGDTVAAKTSAAMSRKENAKSENNDLTDKEEPQIVTAGSIEKKDEAISQSDDVSESSQNGYYRNVISGEREKRSISNKDYFTKLRDRLALEAISPETFSGTPTDDDFAVKAKVADVIDENGKIKYCYCGFRNKPGSKFCTRCGMAVQPDIPAEAAVKSDETFAARQPESTPFKREETVFMAPVVCSCGKIVRDGSTLCPRCGKALR